MITLRRPDSCARCSASLPAGTEAYWDRPRRQVTCEPCHAVTNSIPPPGGEPELDPGEAGASLKREYERRKRNREERVRRRHPHLGGFLLWLNDEPQDTRAFRAGELGEKAIADSLERRLSDGSTIVLKNRAMPRGRGDIDFIVVAPSGVYVVDAKAVKGKVRIEKPLFRADKLLLNGRNRTNWIDGLDRQVAAVRQALPKEAPLQGAICFTEAELPLLSVLFGALEMRGHLVLYRRGLAKRLNADGPLTRPRIETLGRRLAAAFPRA
jgi:hypothetical protein